MRASCHFVLRYCLTSLAANSLTFSALAVPPPPPAPEPAAAAPAPPPVAPQGEKKPRVAPKPPAAAPARPAAQPAPKPEESASGAEVKALREEVKSLRDELQRAVGAPATAAPADNRAERTRLEADLGAEKKRLSSIQAAIAAGLDPSTVADAVKQSEARIAELEANLARPPSPEQQPVQVRSLHDVSLAVERLDAKVSEKPPAAVAIAVEAPAPAQETKQDPERLTLLPLEFTGVGDIFYAFRNHAPDNFQVGAIEMDAALTLSPYVQVTTSFAYDGEAEDFGVVAFVVDCGLFGEGEGFLAPSSVVRKSGVAFGRFFVPFGIAYLEYAAIDNRLGSVPEAVEAIHGEWNDIGVQAYAIADHWTALAYLVNGPEVPTGADSVQPALSSVGGRLSGKVDGVFEVGGSAAASVAEVGEPLVYAGGDLTGIAGSVEVRAEYLLRHADAPGVTPDTHGFYGRAVVDFEPFFAVARFDSVYANSEPLDRHVRGGGGVQVFPQGELRLLYDQNVDTDDRAVFIQIAGGSTLQPTGLRR